MTAAVRLDQWLRAARFFRTRTLARQAIEAGQVRCAGERCKPARDVRIGMALTVRRGGEEFDIVIAALSTLRGGAPQAQGLYKERPESVERRERQRLERRLAGEAAGARPSKKGRRMLERFKRSLE